MLSNAIPKVNLLYTDCLLLTFLFNLDNCDLEKKNLKIVFRSCKLW